MGEGFYFSGQERGIIYTDFYGSSTQSNNAIAISGQNLGCLAHLTDTRLIRLCGKVNGAKAVHIRTGNQYIPDSEVEKTLIEMGIKTLERKIVNVERQLTVAFDMDNHVLYEFQLGKGGRVLYEF